MLGYTYEEAGSGKEHNPEDAGIDLSLPAHINPIAWSNVILYGGYKLNKDLVK